MKIITKKNSSITLVVILFVSLVVSILSIQDSSGIRGRVEKIIQSNSDSQSNNPTRYGDISILIASGKHKGERVIVKNIISETTKAQSIVHVGNEVLLNIDENKDGTIKTVYIYQVIRYNALKWLLISFLCLLVLIGGIKGIKSILTLLLTSFAVLKVLIPGIIAGFDPIFISIIICIGVTIFNMLILMGKNRKTLSAIIGTSIGLLIAGVLSAIVTYQINLKGLGDEEMQMLIYMTKNINFSFSGLFLSGILLGALGAVMDVSISIVSAICEIINVNPNMSIMELFKSGMNVGKDIMGSMANTLILAYAGSSMYTLLLTSSYGMSFTSIMNQDVMASEILKALAGSIGIVLTIPVTALAAAYLMKRDINKT